MTRQEEFEGLISLASTQQALVGQYLNSLSPNTPDASSTSLPPNPPNPLHVLRDSATLLKAHITKLSLLLINKPFTISAIQKVLRDISTTCLPAMMSAVQICQPEIWSSFLHHQVMARVRTVMREMDVCYSELAQITTGELKVVESPQGKTKSKSKADQGRDSLTSTAVIWDACDALVDLDSAGISGLAVKKAGEWRDTIKDAIAELKEWEEGDGEDDDDGFAGSDDDDDDDDDEDDDDHDSVDDIFSAANALPKDRRDLKKLLATTDDKLKKIAMLYVAINKRRLSTFTPAIAGIKSNIHALDQVLELLKQLPDSVDDLASTFYDLDADLVEEALEKCVQQAREAAQLVKLSWSGKEDEFTTWANKWLDMMK